MLKNVLLNPTDYRGYNTTVAHYNGRIFVGENHEKLRIMNEDLEVIQSFGAAIPLAQSISANQSYIATSDCQARVRHDNEFCKIVDTCNYLAMVNPDQEGICYYKRYNNSEPMVS